MRVGPLAACIEEGFARANGRVVPLTKREFRLLVALMRGADHVVRRDDLYREVWADSLRGRDRSVDVYVFKLRGKLEQALPGWSFIHTHTGWGYRLNPEPSGTLRSRTTGTRRTLRVASHA